VDVAAGCSFFERRNGHGDLIGCVFPNGFEWPPPFQSRLDFKHVYDDTKSDDDVGKRSCNLFVMSPPPWPFGRLPIIAALPKEDLTELSQGECH